MLKPRDIAVSTEVPAGGHRSNGNHASTNLGDRVRSLSLSRLPERQSGGSGSFLKVVGLVAVAAALWYAYATYLNPPAEPQATTVAAIERDKSAARPATPGPTTSAMAAGTAPRPQPATTGIAKAEIALEAKGYVVPAHQILVSPKVSGMIVELNVEEGRRVAKGDVLAVLESTDYAAEVERARAYARLARERLRELENGSRPEEIKQAEAELQETEAMLPQLESEYKRAADLRRRSSTTQQDFEQSESKYLAQQKRADRLRFALKLLQLGPREEKIAAAKAEVAQADADVVKAEWRLGNCTIRAPISGTILKKNAEEGNIVNPIAFNGSYSLCDMADLSDLEVDLNVQERDIALVRVGQKCRVRVEAYPERVYEGQVDRLMPIADRAKGAIPVRVKVTVPAAEEGVYLKPEMGAIVTFLNPAATAVAAQEESPAARPLEATP